MKSFAVWHVKLSTKQSNSLERQLLDFKFKCLFSAAA